MAPVEPFSTCAPPHAATDSNSYSASKKKSVKSCAQLMSLMANLSCTCDAWLRKVAGAAEASQRQPRGRRVRGQGSSHASSTAEPGRRAMHSNSSDCELCTVLHRLPRKPRLVMRTVTTSSGFCVKE
ncbi:hypothetical protein E2C01_073067 [Portunus trituberculatus]|uniref:Uncharacterized protein n=1 Tax=Portunus trituberculatus TaxID=210409 RepID=A0A5B7IAP2_PORTR|nr:hypothetical protein [Portunus trituberculatus]